MSIGRQAGTSYGAVSSGPRAGFWQRLAALIIDALIVGIVNGVLQLALHTTGYVLGAVVAISYWTYMEGRPQGATFGEMAMGLRVISLADGQPIGYGRAFIRYIGRIVSSVVILLGYFWMLWDKERQTWHDKFAGAVVVPAIAYPPPGR